MNGVRVRLLGVRGSMPVHGGSCALFGGETSCVLYQAGDETVILDAGTGLMWEELPQKLSGARFTMLLTHAHVDHIVAFPMFSPLFNPKCECDVYLRTREGRTALEQLETLMAPPLWPVRTNALRACIRFHDVPQTFPVGGIRVESMEVPHPGGSTAYKLSWRGASVVYATDAELDKEDLPAFCRFAQGCDLMLLDAQYTQEEYRTTRGFGHMPIRQAVEVALRCQARQTLLVHHAPARTDAQLLEWEQELQKHHPNIRVGRAGDEWAWEDPSPQEPTKEEPR